VFRATWRVLPGPVGFKLPFLLADLAVAAMLAGGSVRLGDGTTNTIYAWNPLVVVEFASSGHNDALAIAGVVATLLIIRRLPAMSTLTLTAGRSRKHSRRAASAGTFPCGWPAAARMAGRNRLRSTPVWYLALSHRLAEFLEMLKYYQMIGETTTRASTRSCYGCPAHMRWLRDREGVVLGWLCGWPWRADATRARFV